MSREMVIGRSGLALGLTHVGVQWLVGIGIFVFCLTASVFLISSLSALKVDHSSSSRMAAVCQIGNSICSQKGDSGDEAVGVGNARNHGGNAAVEFGDL